MTLLFGYRRGRAAGEGGRVNRSVMPLDVLGRTRATLTLPASCIWWSSSSSLRSATLDRWTLACALALLSLLLLRLLRQRCASHGTMSRLAAMGSGVGCGADVR
jgi:hypothetical protein